MNRTGLTTAAVFLLIIFLNTSHSYAQTLNIKNYTSADGIPEQMIFDVLQDDSGVMWFATIRGIYTYDGYEWKKQGEEAGVPAVQYEKLFKDELNNIWALPFDLTYPLYCFDGQNWYPIDMNAGGFVNPSSIYIKNEGDKRKIIITTFRKGILLNEGNNWRWLKKSDGLLNDLVLQIQEFNNKIYFLTSEGICVLEGDSVQPINLLNALPGIAYTAFVQNSEGIERMWLLGREWLGYIENDQLYLINVKINIPSATPVELYYLVVEDKSRVFFGNRSAAFILDLNSLEITVCDRKNGFITEGATSIFIDYEKNIWMTSLRGVSKIIKTHFNNLYKSDGLLADEISAVQQLEDGTIILGYNYGISFLKDNSIKNINFINRSNDTKKVLRILDIIKTKDQKILATSNNKGLLLIDNNKSLKWFNRPEIISYYSVLETINGEILLGSGHGLYKLSGNQLVHNQNVPNDLYRRLIQRSDGKIFAGTPYGLYEFSDNDVKVHKTQIKEANNIFSFHFLSENELLLGTMAGLFLFNNHNIQKYSNGNLNISNPVFFITKDSQGNLWFGLDIGVARWDGANLTYFNTSTGLAGNETNRAAGFVDKDGRLWIGTDNGVSIYDYSLNEIPIVKPKIKLLYVQDNSDARHYFNEEITVPYNLNNLNFSYRALSFIDESKSRFHVKLENLQTGWVDEYSTSEPFARFINLDPGKYKFSVKVRNIRGLESEFISSSIITVGRPFYDEWWFYALSILAIGFLFYNISNYYTQRKYARSLELVVKKRTNMLESSEKHYRTLVETSPDGILIVGEDDIIKFNNKHSCEILGFNLSEDLSGRNVFQFVPPDKFEEAKAIKQNVFTTGWGRSIEFEIISNYGKRTPVEVNMNVLINSDTGERNAIVVFRDITEIKNAHHRLQNMNIELEARVNEKTRELRSLIDQSPLGIVVFDIKGNVVECNQAFAKIFGIENNKKLLDDYNLLKDVSVLKNDNTTKLDQLFSHGGNVTLSKIQITENESELFNKLENMILDLRFYSVNNPSGFVERIVAIIEDVTEKVRIDEIREKFAEQKLRSSIILETVENERKRIARDLHDSLGQLFTTAKLKIEIFQHKTNIENEHLTDALKLILSGGREISNIVNDLHPIEIEKYGLASSIELMCEKFRDSYNKNIELNSDTKIKPLKLIRELSIYRIVQEALLNSLKHSDGEKIIVNLKQIEDMLVITIEDNGKGFPIDGKGLPLKTGRYGIIGIHERAALFGDEVKFESAPGKGTKVTIKARNENNE